VRSMIISLIVAMDEERGIGRQNALPWKLSDDLKRFKALTMGHTLILGRKTYHAIGRPLPGRMIIILTRNPDYAIDGCRIARTLHQALELAAADGENEVFIGGGGEVFAQALPHTDRIYLTQVHASLECDVFFPQLVLNEWIEVERSFHPANDKNQYPSTFYVLERKG
jgi:dihydrofolate reductase